MRHHRDAGRNQLLDLAGDPLAALELDRLGARAHQLGDDLDPVDASLRADEVGQQRGRPPRAAADVEEAVVLADHVVVLHPRPGRIGEVRAIALAYPRDPLSEAVSEEVRRLRISLSAARARC